MYIETLVVVIVGAVGKWKVLAFFSRNMTKKAVDSPGSHSVKLCVLCRTSEEKASRFFTNTKIFPQHSTEFTQCFPQSCSHLWKTYDFERAASDILRAEMSC